MLLFLVSKQFLGDHYWNRAHHYGNGHDRVIEYLEKCKSVDSHNALYHFSLGRAYLGKSLDRDQRINEKNRWLRKTIDEFQRAIECRPVESDYHFHLAISYGSLPYPPPFYWDVVENAFKRAVLLNPTDTRRLFSVGTYYLNEYQRLKNVTVNNKRSDLADYMSYAERARNNCRFFFTHLLGLSEEYLGKILDLCFSVTREYGLLREMIRHTPTDHAFLARFLDEKGLWEEAKREYREAINLEQTNPIHYTRFARALFHRGQYGDAITWWRKQKALDPRDEKSYLFLAECFMRMNQFDGAVRELRQLVILLPEEINYRVKTIKILLAARRIDDAIDEYQKVVEEFPVFSKATYERVRYYQRKRDYTKATKILKKALFSVHHQ